MNLYASGRVCVDFPGNHGLICGISSVPLLNLFRSSVWIDGQFSLANFRKFFGRSYYYSTIFNSFKIAVCTTAITLFLGFWLAYIYTMYEIRGKTFLQILIIALIIRRIPYTIRSSIATLQQIPLSVEEASISLGTSKMKTFFVITVPMMANGILSGAILSWITIMTELSTGIILYTNKTMTMTMAIYNFVSRACLKIAFWQMCVTVCGRFGPNEGRIVGYVT